MPGRCSPGPAVQRRVELIDNCLKSRRWRQNGVSGTASRRIITGAPQSEAWHRRSDGRRRYRLRPRRKDRHYRGQKLAAQRERNNARSCSATRRTNKTTRSLVRRYVSRSLASHPKEVTQNHIAVKIAAKSRAAISSLPSRTKIAENLCQPTGNDPAKQ